MRMIMKEKLKEFFKTLSVLFGRSGQWICSKWNNLGKTGQVLLLVLVLVVELIIFFILLPDRKKTLPPAPEVRVAVEVIKAVADDRPDMIILSGLVLADMDAALAAEKPGRVVELLAERGQSVTNGQVLLRLDDRAARAAADAARIALEDAARNLTRFEKLSGTGAVSQKALDDIRKAHDLAEAEQRQAAAALSYCTVKSPADGIINERYVEKGEYVQPGSAVFDVLSIDPVRVTVDIPERNIASIQPGDLVPFSILSLPDGSFTGRVSYVSAKANMDNNAFRVELTAANPARILRPGMIAAVQHLRSLRKQAVALPLSAIIPKKGDNVVFIVRDGRAVRQMVRIDTILKQEAVILSGVEAGDSVVTRGNRMLSDGTKVEIKN